MTKEENSKKILDLCKKHNLKTNKLAEATGMKPVSITHYKRNLLFSSYHLEKLNEYIKTLGLSDKEKLKQIQKIINN